MSQFIENCESVIELKLVIMNLEKVASSKQLMKCLADLTASCKQLIFYLALQSPPQRCNTFEKSKN